MSFSGRAIALLIFYFVLAFAQTRKRDISKINKQGYGLNLAYFLYLCSNFYFVLAFAQTRERDIRKINKQGYGLNLAYFLYLCPNFSPS